MTKKQTTKTNQQTLKKNKIKDIQEKKKIHPYADLMMIWNTYNICFGELNRIFKITSYVIVY